MDWHAIPVEDEILVNQLYKYFEDTNNWKNCEEHWLNSKALALEMFNLKNDKQWKSKGICDGFKVTLISHSKRIDWAKIHARI